MHITLRVSKQKVLPVEDIVLSLPKFLTSVFLLFYFAVTSHHNKKMPDVH